MMRSRWQQDIRIEMMREAAGQLNEMCRRCGAYLEHDDDLDGKECNRCQYNDWHEEYPDIPDLCPEEEE